MKYHLNLILLALVLVGCGGEPFTSAIFSETGGTSQDDAGGAPGTGGASAESGGRPASGGAPAMTGGIPATTGGAPSAGGASTGGVVESGGSPATGGASATGGLQNTGGAPVADACALVTHDNGLGQTWEDCVSLGTYDLEQAMKACEASGAPKCIDASATGCGAVIGYNMAVSRCTGGWGYGGQAAGFTSSIDFCSGCPNYASGATWN